MTNLTKPIIVDGHEDLAWNILTFNRDYTRSVNVTRQLETGTAAPLHNDDTLLGWPEYQQGRVAVIFSTLFVSPTRRKVGEWDTQCYSTDREANTLYHRQLDVYHRLADEYPDLFWIITNRTELTTLLEHWKRTDTDQHPVGLLLLMENAEGVRPPADLEEWWAGGVRIIGPAWAGTRYCGGTGEPGGLTAAGRILLERMAEYGFILDISHMDAPAALQAIDRYPRQVIVSHGNAARLLPGSESNRHLPDEVILSLIERQGVIGIVPSNGFLKLDWNARGGRKAVSLDLVVAQIDHICQLAGNARHAALGSDFDGGFGLQSVPVELDSIADLQKLAPSLEQKGYTENDINDVLGMNWLRILQENLPEVA